MEIFSVEELNCLKIFYAAGVDFIKRIQTGDITAGSITKGTRKDWCKETQGRILPQELFPNVEEGKEYYLEDIFGEDKDWHYKREEN